MCKDCSISPAGGDLTGVYHLRVAFDEANVSSTALRLEAVDDGYSGLLFSRPAQAVEVTKDSVAVDISADNVQGLNGHRALTLTSIDSNGKVGGTYESCNAKECFTATVIGQKVDPLVEPEADGVRLISEYGGPPSGEWLDGTFELTLNVRVKDGMAYLARARDGLRIIDLANPARPVERGHLAVLGASDGEYFNDVKMATGPTGTTYALLASNRRGIVVVEVSDPDAPREVTSFPSAEDAPGGVPSTHTLFIEGSRAYVAYTFDASLRIYDIADPAKPVPLGLYRSPRLDVEGGYLHDLYVADGRVYLDYWNLGLVIVDTQDNPADPVLVGTYDDYGQNTSHSNWVTQAGGRLVSVHGDEEYGAHVRIIDVDDSKPTFLSTLASYQTREAVSVHNILCHGDRAYVTYYQDGLRILDIADPTRPKLVGHFHTWPGFGPDTGFGFFEGAIGVDVDPATGTIYLADTHRGLLVLATE